MDEENFPWERCIGICQLEAQFQNVGYILEILDLKFQIRFGNDASGVSFDIQTGSFKLDKLWSTRPEFI